MGEVESKVCHCHTNRDARVHPVAGFAIESNLGLYPVSSRITLERQIHMQKYIGEKVLVALKAIGEPKERYKRITRSLWTTIRICYLHIHSSAVEPIVSNYLV